jgi:hypothetical protein
VLLEGDLSIFQMILGVFRVRRRAAVLTMEPNSTFSHRTSAPPRCFQRPGSCQPQDCRSSYREGRIKKITASLPTHNFLPYFFHPCLLTALMCCCCPEFKSSSLVHFPKVEISRSVPKSIPWNLKETCKHNSH